MLGKSIFAKLNLNEMTRVIFYINRTKKLKNCTVPIYVRITVNKQRSDFAICRFIDPEKWNIELGRVIGTSKSAKEIKSSHLEMLADRVK